MSERRAREEVDESYEPLESEAALSEERRGSVQYEIAEPVLADEQLVYNLLRETQLSGVIDLQTLTCLDRGACENLVLHLIRHGVTRHARLSESQVRWFRSIILYGYLSSTNPTRLTPWEKLSLAKLLCLASFMLFMIAKDCPQFLSLLKTFAVMVHVDEPDRAAARLVCNLFMRSDDTPDTWLRRVQTTAFAILNAAASAVALRPHPELVTE